MGNVRARSVRLGFGAVALALLAAGCGDDGSGSVDVEIGGTVTARGPVAWPAPDAEVVSALAEEAEAPLELRETLVHHVHSHLDVFIDGRHRVVPAGIGIVITDPGVQVFDEVGGTSYGGIGTCDKPCISPLHTHDGTGVVHTESATDEERTLGQFFSMWDVRLTGDCIGEHCTSDTEILIYVDGEEVPLADASDIALTDEREIAIVIGDPPDRIPSEADFSVA